MSDERKISAADRAVLDAAASGHGLIPVTAEQLAAYGAAATETMAVFKDRVNEVLTVTRAEFVRHLRVDEEYTWRAIAETCALEWGEEWGSNQLAGMALCGRAASFFGEDYQTAPWN